MKWEESSENESQHLVGMVVMIVWIEQLLPRMTALEGKMKTAFGCSEFEGPQDQGLSLQVDTCRGCRLFKSEARQSTLSYKQAT